jgi:hypothetical protein
MNTHRAAWLAWSLAALSVAIFLAGVPLYVLVRSANVPSSWDANLSIGTILGGALFLIFPLVGALIASRRPGNPIGWILLADGLVWILTGTMDVYTVYGVATPGAVPFPLVVAGINNFMWVPAVGLLGTYVFLLFPNGRLPSGRWRPLAWLSASVILWLSVGIALAPGPLQYIGGCKTRSGCSNPG